MPVKPATPPAGPPDQISNLPSTGAWAKRFLPRIGSPAYHVMLSCVAILILGPLGGVSAAFMNFSIGFFIGGAVFAGHLGGTVALAERPDSPPAAHNMQNRAGPIAGLFALIIPWFARWGLSAGAITRLGNMGISASTVGAGMIVGARIAIPALVVGLIGLSLTPYLRSIDWLAPGESYRKIGFIIS